ncbi:hypothetical protein [Streptomyces sp. HUAS TT20]|uniref:hypothetical protein n=1 Tax=Streptomyces sp. HUAS TT20 TaxID=3447509 RepID=UPI0021DA06F8|nr:hypothetical protein [Streptomyces sp. HUAS 15-9]UXY30516.1 hypothetical protein N8I87_30845 [Streptomyces sp. HUAS 15-9]
MAPPRGGTHRPAPQHDLTGDPRAVAAYRDERRRLQREAVLGTGELIETLLHERRSRLAALRQLAWVRRLFDVTHHQVRQVLAAPRYAAVLPLRRSMLVHLAELPLPLPADDLILSHPTHAPSAEILPELPQLRPWRDRVLRILAESSLAEHGTPFRTVGPPHAAVILGADGPTVGALAGVAHELGHCLYERSRPGTGIRARIASERLAHRLEEQLTAVYLREHGSAEECRRWWLYQRQVDAFNLYYFELERALMYEEADAVEELTTESASALRESLFIVPGSQAVYARASLARLPVDGPQ